MIDPVSDTIDQILAYETPNMRWLRDAGEKLRAMREAEERSALPETGVVVDMLGGVK